MPNGLTYIRKYTTKLTRYTKFLAMLGEDEKDIRENFW